MNVPLPRESIEQHLAGQLQRRRWVVGFSGGVDSSVLLWSAHQYLLNRAGHVPALHALHVHHGLSAAADDWQRHCQSFCAELDVPLHTHTVTVTPSGDGVEAAAREARYAAFENVLQADDVLLLGHHRDDQAETLLLALMRGSGVLGLQGMPRQRPLGNATLLRPLLDCSRAELEQLARQAGLRWVEDDSNRELSYSRNFLRHEVLPLLTQQWPQAMASIAHSSDVLRQEAALLAELAEADLVALQIPGAAAALAIDGLQALSAPRRINVLRYWLAQFDLRLRTTQLRALLREVLGAAEDAQPVLSLPGYQLRRHRNALHCVADAPLPQSLQWSPPQSSDVPGWGRLVVTEGDGEALRRGDYQLRFRDGGERAQPSDRAHSTALKKLFQEYAVPQWERERWPLLFDGEQLAAVPGLFVCAGYQTAPGEPGWHLRRDPIHCAPS